MLCLLLAALPGAAFIKPPHPQALCSLSGRLTDSVTAEPIPFANVFLFQNQTQIANATTDMDGEYCFKNIPDGTYNIKVTYVGYVPKEIKKVTVKAGVKARQNISISTDKGVRLDEVVIVEYAQPKIDADTKSGSVVTRQEYQSMQVKSINSVASHQQAVIRGGRITPGVVFIDGEKYNTEEYSRMNDNEFKSAKRDPLSTFSIDVDKASYSNVRRYITQGILPPADAVRVEEMINYFSYRYEAPKGNVPFSIHTEYTECPWNPKHTMVHIGLQGKQVNLENMPANNLVFLLDVSGSMDEPNKLPLLKSGLRLLVEQMRPQDKVAIVVYAGAAGLVLPSTPGTKKEKILDALDQLQAGGSTAGGEGILLAYKTARDNFDAKANNRVILATDGDFNVGVSSDGDLTRLIEEKRKEGVYLTVLGFGMGNYKDSKMEQLADKGNGNYAYIDNILEAKKVLVKEMGGTLLTIAKDVKLQIEFNPAKVKGYRLVGYENRMLANEDFNDDKKDAGELGSGHTVTAIYELIPAGSNENIASIDSLKYQQVSTGALPLSEEVMTIKFRYKEPQDTSSRLLSQVVLDKKIPFTEASENCRFSSSVAEFGMVLRDSKFKGKANYASVLALARDSKGKDDEGYRSEFIRLVEMAELIKH
ncbi:MAG: von Willebrand factor type A domain-containing protein [Bacteroidetes bacterium]|nr:von Willebrand factor type A domain-containing protein [Bacteroidota bacterium]